MHTGDASIQKGQKTALIKTWPCPKQELNAGQLIEIFMLSILGARELQTSVKRSLAAARFVHQEHRFVTRSSSNT
jgi:hypothetical protein